MTFIGLQVLGSISFLSGNESSVETDLKTIENKNVGTKNQDIDNHVNLKKLKNDQSNVANKDESIIENPKDDTKQKLSKLESKSSNSVNIYKEHPEVQYRRTRNLLNYFRFFQRVFFFFFSRWFHYAFSTICLVH